MTPLRFLIILVSIFTISIVALGIYVNDVVSEGLPDLAELENPTQNLATQVYSADGRLLDMFSVERRIRLPLDSIPGDFINGLIATEDREFHNHWGVHLERVIKAAVKTIRHELTGAGKREGASTITMQLARNLFLNLDISFERKIREAFVAVQIEKTYTKNEILEMYSNTVPFGRGAYGINVASRVYFDKTPSELTTAECAFLVAILKTPERYNGRDMELAIGRRNLVLSLMRNQGFIGESEFMSAIEEPINLKTGKIKETRSFFAPHFVEMVRQTLGKDDNVYLDKGYDLYRDGLIINTTINTRIQKYANEAVEEHLSEFQKLFERNWNWRWHKELLDEHIKKAIRKRADYLAGNKVKRRELERKLKKDKKFVDSVKNVLTTIQTGLVVIEPNTGRILAMVGASPKFMKEHSDSKYSLNHATQIRRQPGSSFKPFVYALVLEKGRRPDSLVECGPYSYELITGDIWNPGGSRCEEGETISLSDALRRSINSVAARLVTQVTNPQAVVNLCRRCGIESPLHSVPAIALGGGGEVKPIELVSAFGTFAYDGYHVDPFFITKIEDHFGNILYEKKQSKSVRDALKKETTYKLTKMLQNVISGGTGWRVKQYFTGVDAAGKTGTTNENADTWFVGYTPELVAGAWVGFDDQRVTFGKYGEGGRASAPIWGRLMSKIYKDKDLPYKKRKFDFHVLDSIKLHNMTFMNDSTRVDSSRQSSSDRNERRIQHSSPSNQFPRLPREENNREPN